MQVKTDLPRAPRDRVKSLGLKHYSCVLKGKGAEQGKGYPINYTVPVVASDETDEVKLCLLRAKAHQYKESATDQKITFLVQGPNGVPMFVEDIEILLTSGEFN